MPSVASLRRIAVWQGQRQPARKGEGHAAPILTRCLPHSRVSMPQLAVWRGQRQPALEGTELGHAALPGLRNVRLHLALLLQQPRPAGQFVVAWLALCVGCAAHTCTWRWCNSPDLHARFRCRRFGMRFWSAHAAVPACWSDGGSMSAMAASAWPQPAVPHPRCVIGSLCRTGCHASGPQADPCQVRHPLHPPCRSS